jgi:hypothetical protein
MDSPGLLNNKIISMNNAQLPAYFGAGTEKGKITSFFNGNNTLRI